MSASTYQPLLGANLTDADVTKSPGTDKVAEYILPIVTLTANRTLTLGTGGSPATRSLVRIIRLDREAHTYVVKDDAATTLFTFPASQTEDSGASFYFDGTHWAFLSTYKVDALPEPKAGTDLTDANQTLQPFTDKASQYTQVTALTASRTKTLGTTTVVTGTLVRIVRADAAAFTMPIVNGGVSAGTLFTFASTPTEKQAATFYYNGADWVLVGFEYLAV